MSWYGWRPYVSATVRRAQAARKLKQLARKGLAVQPVHIDGRAITRTFWGKAWCAHLEAFSDFSNRLPRGRSYVRNGSVCHLEIASGAVKANVVGSRLYDVEVAIKALPRKKWTAVKTRCAGQIGSVLELLHGRLSDRVMAVVTDRENGLFPLPAEIRLQCSCPDWAVMCKHVAAVLYGVGARLDERPELLFLLRGIDHEELIAAGAGAAMIGTAKAHSRRRRIDVKGLEEIFGIELQPRATRVGPRKQRAKRAAAAAQTRSR